MIKFFKKLSAVLMVLALVASMVSFYQPQKAKAAFDPSNLISDSVFENTGSMSVSQINTLINTYPSSCVGGSVTTPDPHGWDNVGDTGYVFGGNVPVSQAIDSIALNYHLNPQVIITTLQKEQSLITGSAGCYNNEPDPATDANSPCGTAKTPCTLACTHAGGCMNIAMSYGCPNYCGAVDEGFSTQLTLGSWLLRFSEERAYGLLTGYTGYENGDKNYCYSGPMTPGSRARSASATACGGVHDNVAASYDGLWTTSDGTSVRITNGATASLYVYTPFVNGNQSFVNLFQNTFSFGSTLSGGCVGSESPLPYVQIFYNSRTFEHFYSAYACDVNFLSQIGFVNEGPIFNTTLSSLTGLATPVYRYYNASTGLHMWSMTFENNTQLAADGAGYQLDNSGVPVFYVDSSSDPHATAVYRFYNPQTYLHLWASSAGLTVTNLGTISQAGYTLEGAVFYTQ